MGGFLIIKKVILFETSNKDTEVFNEIKNSLNILFSCDNDNTKLNCSFHGIKIISPMELIKE